MNDANFYESFVFNIFKFNHYHFTDLSKTPVPRHYFGCLIRGHAVIRSEGQELRLQPGEIFYIPKGLHYQSHWYGDEGGKIEFYSFGFSHTPSPSTYILQKVACDPEASDLFQRLCRELPNRELSIGLLYHFFGLVAGQLRRADKPYSHPVVEKAIRFIEKNPSARCSQVAQHCSISESGIYALFRKYTGKTPNQVRLEAQCQMAVNLLSTTNRPVQQISDAAGFSSTSYFRKLLRKYTGKTPLQIRKDALF